MKDVAPYLKHKFGSQLRDTDLEGIATAAFFTAYRKGIDFDREPVAYIKKIAYNDALKWVKERKKEWLVDQTDPTGLLALFGGEAADADPSDAVARSVDPKRQMAAGTAVAEAVATRLKEDADVWDVVDPAISTISAQQQHEVILRQSLGHDDDRIAADLGISRNQIYQQRHRGIAVLRKELKQYIRPGGQPPTPTAGEQ
ncbi:RNA polymerase sigma factor [Streptomyces globosus]|nr:sigma-70 family RNA polymerase sigma factor [Streptomyces globosus]